jgi:hypothetical protein
MMDGELRGVCVETGTFYFKVTVVVFAWRDWENHKNTFGHLCKSSCRDLNHIPPEYKATAALLVIDRVYGSCD